MDRRILFVAPGPIDTWSSSRFRGLWPARHIPGAQIVDIQQGIIPEADVYIWVKKTTPELLERPGLHFWDVCDPVWWFQPVEAAEIAKRVRATVASNEGLAKDFTKWCGLGCHVIPDRLDLGHYPLQRKHGNEKPLRLIWFGAAQNRVALFGAIAALERLKANGVSFILTIFDDRPDAKMTFTGAFPVVYTKWELESENAVLAAHDIAVLPDYPGEWGKVKSNNKKLTAWASGLAVWDGQDYDDLRHLAIFPEARQAQAETMRGVVSSVYDVKYSGRDWSHLIEGYGDDTQIY